MTGGRVIRFIALSFIVLFFVIAVAVRTLHFRIISSDSACAVGLYRETPLTLRRGTLVDACLPLDAARFALERGYLHSGDCINGVEPIAKVIGALPGDTIDIERGWIAVNGIRLAHSATVSRDTAGRLLPHVPWGTRRVAVAELWLFGFNNPRSWDGRYFGAVTMATLRNNLKGIATW